MHSPVNKGTPILGWKNRFNKIFDRQQCPDLYSVRFQDKRHLKNCDAITANLLLNSMKSSWMFSGRTRRFEYWETTAKQQFDQIFNDYLNILENEWQDLKSNVECGQKSNVGRCSPHSVHFPLFTKSIVGLKQTFDSMRTKLSLHQLFPFIDFIFNSRIIMIIADSIVHLRLNVPFRLVSKIWSRVWWLCPLKVWMIYTAKA
jgi:hypothetical protein